MFWIQAIIGGISFLINCFVLVETRGSTLLSRRAEKLTELTGKLHAAPGDKEKGDLGTLLRVSLTRPIIFLFTEPIVAGVSLWVAFVWGTLFLFIQSASLIFEQYSQSDSSATLLTRNPILTSPFLSRQTLTLERSVLPSCSPSSALIARSSSNVLCLCPSQIHWCRRHTRFHCQLLSARPSLSSRWREDWRQT